MILLCFVVRYHMLNLVKGQQMHNKPPKVAPHSSITSLLLWVCHQSYSLTWGRMHELLKECRDKTMWNWKSESMQSLRWSSYRSRSQRHVPAFNADGHCMGGCLLHLLLLLLPQMFLIAVEGLLGGAFLAELLVYVPFRPHNVTFGGRHWHTRSTDPTFVPWFLGSGRREHIK